MAKTFKFEDSEDVYDNIGVLGEGSYGTVYKVMSPKSEVLALKMLPIEEDQTREDILREIQVMRTCKGPFIIDYLNHMEKGETIFILMELCSAGSVSDIMQICNLHFTESVIKEIIGASTLGLAYMHEKNIVHRDIKAGNLLLTSKGEIKLGDFGVSAILRSAGEKRNTVIGTPFWMSPEIIQELPYDGKADVWAMGITVIEIAEQEPPYADQPPLSVMLKIPSRPPPKLQNANLWSKQMVQFVTWCLQKQESKRATSQELLAHKFLLETVGKLRKNPKSDKLARIVEDNLDEVEAYRKMEARSRNGGTENMDDDSSDEEDAINFYGYGDDESYKSNKLAKEKKQEAPVEDYDFQKYVANTLGGAQNLQKMEDNKSDSGFGPMSQNIQKADQARIELSGEKEKLLEQCRLELMKCEEIYRSDCKVIHDGFVKKRAQLISDRVV